MTAPREDAGAAALTTMLTALAFALVSLVVFGGVADLALAAGRARLAADAAALAAMGSSSLVAGDGRPCDHAARLAAANGARLLACTGPPAAGWPLRVEVRVAATPIWAIVRTVAGDQEASAAAAVRPALRRDRLLNGRRRYHHGETLRPG